MNIYKYVLLFLVIFVPPSTYGEYNPGTYYFCEDEFGESLNGVFGIQQRNGTISNPNHYDPKQPSREYIYFLYSKYPIPFGYASIISETDKEIFARGIHYDFLSQSGKDEFYVVIINKEDLSMRSRAMNYKGEVFSFKTECSENMDDVRK